ncbi:MAG: DUF6191 domain-containing protein [Bifidobacteriaceae bacterium]|nr:DUF6191 domain-containing protein [Bifidobacteriaceae bacterium]
MTLNWSEVFEPGLRYWNDEKNRLRFEPVEVSNADPPKDVDLDAGTAVIRVTARETEG